MIKKLRLKFILIAMISLFLVLGIIITSMNILNYTRVINTADETLSILKSNNGHFPIFKDYNWYSPELPYESRFFSVIISEAGIIISSDTDNIAAIDSKAAIELAQNAIISGQDYGFQGNYRYVLNDMKYATQVIFLDCTRNLEIFHSFLVVSITISIIGMIAVFILIYFISGMVVKPALESYEKQKRFITDAGHEIKTPITIINADAEVLEMELEDNEWLKDIKLQTKRLTSLTNDLIFLSRMDENNLKLQFIDFPFSDVVTETSQSFQSLAHTQNKTFVTSIEPMITMHGDEKSLKQLVSILLDNALKYSQENGYIELSLKKQNKNVVLIVKNTSDSIAAEENLNNIFDRFYRTDSSRNSQTGGYGIGLSIAKAIVEAHKGKILASSSDNKSLTITINLPIAI